MESRGSRTTDRITKLAEYAEVGIPNYWRVMFQEVPPTVTVLQPFPVTIRPADLLR